MTTKTDRFNEAYEYLEWRHIISRQEDVATAMGSSQSNISQALKGAEKVLTDKFIQRFCKAYPLFSAEYIIDGEGCLLVEDNKKPAQPKDHAGATLIELASELVKENAALRRELSSLILDVKQIRQELANERDALRALLSQILYSHDVQLPIAAENVPQQKDEKHP